MLEVSVREPRCLLQLTMSCIHHAFKNAWLELFWEFRVWGFEALNPLIFFFFFLHDPIIELSLLQTLTVGLVGLTKYQTHEFVFGNNSAF